MNLGPRITMSVTEAAALLGIHRSRMHVLIRTYGLPHSVVKHGSRTRFRLLRTDVEDFAKRARPQGQRKLRTR